MLIAHLPAAYLVLKATAPKTLPKAVWWAALIGGVAPDLDMLWFHFVDMRQHHHHDYLTHRPMLWVTGIVTFSLLWLAHRGNWTLAGFGLCLMALFHLTLDSIAGKISWLWPFSDTATTLVTVPDRYDHWIKNFMLHWTFLVELSICIIAIFIAWRSVCHPK